MKIFAPILALVFIAGCKINATDTKIQYMPDMADGPTVKAQESYINPPDGSVPVNGILYPKTVEEAEKVLKNPYPQTAETLKEGQRLFNTFCIPCHGADAKGEGSISDVYPKPPDISNDIYKKREDGFYFYRITFGSAIMPSYGHAISPNERWNIIHYLRTLQK